MRDGHVTESLGPLNISSDALELDTLVSLTLAPNGGFLGSFSLVRGAADVPDPDPEAVLLFKLPKINKFSSAHELVLPRIHSS